MKITEEKRKIVNLHYIVSTALDRMTENGKRLLVDKVLNKKTFKEISEELGISIRTAFRKFENAQDEFAHNLKIAGYGENWLEAEYKDERHISLIHRRLVDDKYFVS